MSSIIKVDQIQLANGSTPTAGDLGFNTTGSVIQTVSLSDTTRARTATSNTSYVQTDVYNSITPKYANSKIIVRVATSGNNNGTNHQLAYTMFRSIGGGSYSNLRVTGGNEWGLGQVWGQSSRIQVPLIAEIVDEPNTTGEVTYRLYIRSQSGDIVELPATTTEHCEMIIQEIAG